MKPILAPSRCAVFLLTLFLAAFGSPKAPDWAAIKARAETLYAQGSFELARREYAQADPTLLGADDARWLEFRLADTRWRSAAGAPNADTTELDAAKKSLEEMQRKIERVEQRDRVWALVEESLGDWSWQRQNARDTSSAWLHYQNALDWWSAARDVDAARARYLSIAFRMGWPDGGKGDNGWWYGSVPLQVAQNALKIATSEQDRAQAAFLLASVLRNQGGDYDARARMFETLRAVVAQGKGTRFYDDALFRLAEAYEQAGEPTVAEDGSWSVKPDYVAALQLYQRLLEEFGKGDSAWRDPAREAARRILKTEVGVSVPSAFLPGSEIAYALSWRNVPRIDLALYPLDLVRDVQLENDKGGWQDWLSKVDVSAITPRARWTHETHDDGRHVPGSAELHVALPDGAKLAAGAYLLEARGGNEAAREIVLVSSTTLVLKSVGQQTLVWCCDALTSEPVAGATVRLFESPLEGNRRTWRALQATTGADGTALFDLRPAQNHVVFAVARRDERQAFAGSDGWYDAQPGGRWHVMAFTDRSTYKPGDEVGWKVIARRDDGGALTTPKGETLDWEITDPRGTRFAKGTFTLSDFGSAFGSLAPDGTSPLGEYRVEFRTKGQYVGNATLFRLEEYKLPEYEVTVKTSGSDGAHELFVVGDKVDVDIEAAFYSGGAVADADVEVIVRQNPYWRTWSRARDYAWCYDGDESARYRNYGGGQVVKQEKLKTDARGIAHLSFDTPRDLGQDFEYTVEARVTDASRREVSGSGTVRVMRREYDVNLSLSRNLHQPKSAVEVAIEARDANQNPVAAAGSVFVTRERWIEIWIDPSGREVSGAELEDVRRGLSEFPPPAEPGHAGWSHKSSGYRSEEVARASVTLGADGQGSFTFVPQTAGYYSVHWTSRDGRKRPVEAQTWTWVIDESSRDLGFKSNGLEVVVDKDTFRSGERASAMITTAVSNRWVLFTVEGAKLYSFQVVHVEGTAKLVHVDVTEAHVPNAWICGISTLAGTIVGDAKAVVVPPVKQFLDVQVTSDQDPVLPGSKSKLHVVTRSFDGEPVSAEVALSLVDESVASIQADYAMDVRQFFYGEKKQLLVRTATSLDRRPYARYSLDDQGNVKLGRVGGSERDEEGSFAQSAFDKRELKDVARRGSSALKAGSYRGPGDTAPPSAPMVAEALGMNAAERAVGGKADTQATDAVQVRSDFRETALWMPDLVTDAQGRADVDVQYPDSLTRWKAMARVADAGARFGAASTTVRANKPLVARLEAPRFFTVGDDTLVSGVVDNRTDDAFSVVIDLAIDGPLEAAKHEPGTLTIPAQGEVRVDWKVHAAHPGEARITLRARSVEASRKPYSDAMVRTYTVQDHGLEVQVARSLKSKGGELVATLEIPAERAREPTVFTIDVAPSLAVTMLDALPYLVDYPYGCTEQTMSRFLPAAIVAHTLAARGLSADDALSRVFGGIEVESAGVTHPGGKKHVDRLDEITRQSLERLYDFQHQDGGWGWWKGDDSDAWMSAYVVWGLSLAKEAGVDVRDAVLERGAQYLSLEIVKAERDPDQAAWLLHALAASGKMRADEHTQAAFTKLWEQKDALRAYGKALFALAAQSLGKDSQARTLCQNLANGAQIDLHPDQSRIGAAGEAGHADALATAHWGSDAGWWRWQDGAVESTAFALRALARIDPKNALVEQASNWLVQNRRGAQWSNTRDTALAILGLDAFLDASGEVARDVEYELLVNGKTLGKRKLAAQDMLRAPARFTIPAGEVADGPNEIRLRRLAGEGPLYLAARAVFFSREDKIPARGSGIFVKRQYWKLVPRPTLLAGVIWDRVPLEDGGSVVSGERVEVVLTLEAKNDFDYLMFEDMKPAGLEAAAVKSGEGEPAREIKSGEVARRFGDPNALAAAPDQREWGRYTGRQAFLHQELRERKVALFVSHLPQGVWETRYELRAEVPGHFSALPTSGFAMYLPEVRCNGDEVKLTVEDRPAKGE